MTSSRTDDLQTRAQSEHALAISAANSSRLEEALAHFDNVRHLDPAFTGVDQNRAAILQRLHRDDEACAVMRDIVRRDPANLAVHAALNQLLYRLGRDQEFLRSYDEASARLPADRNLALAKARFLLAAERWEDARVLYARALAGGGADAAQGLLLSLSQLGRFAEAVAVGEDAVRKLPDHAPVRAGLASTLLRMGDARAAQPHIGHALSLNPYDQTGLALQGLAWRMADDGREQVLNDYEQAVQVIDIEPPEGYRDMAHFNQDLNAFLDGLHPPVREYVDQSLRQGTQTTGLLFDRGLDLVERLKRRIAEAVEACVANMPDQPEHPFFGRRRKSFRFEGSWSSRLRSQGFHTSHIHAGGWISSCYYVALPDVIADEKGMQGWLEFGRPSSSLEAALSLKNPVRRVIQPAAGQLALFPSYMFHGTVPFRSGQNRTTIAFDALPL